MSDLNVGDEVVLLHGDEAGMVVTIEAIDIDGEHLDVLNPNPCPYCDCDPMMTVSREGVYRVEH